MTTPLINLETRLAFQEHALQQLSEQMALQADELRLAQRQLQVLGEKYRELKHHLGEPSAALMDEKPPHY